MRSRFDVKRAFRRLVAGQAVGQSLYGFSCGPCPPVEYQPPDVMVSVSEVKSGPFETLCAHVCGRRGLKCPRDVSDEDALPVTLPCITGKDRDGRDVTEAVPVDAATFGQAEREAWLTLSDLAQVRARTAPTKGAECYRICAAGNPNRPVEQPASCSVAGGDLLCTPKTTQSFDNCKAGRVPFGLLSPDVDTRSEADRFWLFTQHMEAASVFAFGELAESLEHYGAPGTLVARCLAAADEEREHARLAEAELRARGLAPSAVRRCPHGSLTLLDVALHNAAEGCVSESLAALFALHEAAANEEPSLRAFFAKVAADEAEHAQLAWDLHRWFMEALSEPERRQLSSHLETAAVDARNNAATPCALFDMKACQRLAAGLLDDVLAHVREGRVAA